MATSVRFVSRLIGFEHQLLLTVCPKHLTYLTSRNLSCSGVTYGKKKAPEVKPPGKVKLYAEKKYIGFMSRMESGLEQRYPNAHKLYILVKEGLKEFYSDSKTLYRVSTDMWKGSKLSEFTYSELVVYKQMPREMLRVGPIVILLNLPITDMITPVFVYLFPRQLLCSHFWSKQQKAEFGRYYVRGRTQHYPKILHYMEKHSRDIKDPGHRKLFEGIISKLEDDSQPTVEEILEVKPLFVDDQPFGRAYLMSRHKLLTRHLAKSMDFSTWGSKLSQQALLLHHIDLAMVQEGLDSLTPKQLQQACFTRGLNAAEIDEAEMKRYLSLWTNVNKHVDETTLSLLLHSPVLLAYNHPANRTLFNPNEVLADL